MKASYQLTEHPVGSTREMITLTWPIAVSLASWCLMMFVDRLFLAHYSTAALTAAANAGVACWVISIFAMILAEITEVFTGRHHGAGELSLTAKPAWQMIWLNVIVAPLFFVAGPLLAPWLFHGHSNISHETGYFITITASMPFTVISIALMGFFTGIGRVSVVSRVAVIANIMNIVLDYPFIFGWGPIPAMGATGAALATGLSQVFSVVVLLVTFFGKEFREKYNTLAYHLDVPYLKRMISIGGPNSLNRFLEILAHFVFMQIMIGAGPDRMAVATIIQSIYFMLGFVGDSFSKAMSTIASNLIGGGRPDLVGKVFKTSLTCHFLLFLGLAVVFGFGNDVITGLFFPHDDPLLLAYPHVIVNLNAAMAWMLLFFLFDGFSLILTGILTAGGDTKFIFYAGIVLNWLVYVAPVYLFVHILGGTGDKGWMALAGYSVVCFSAYFWRYRRGKWAQQLGLESITVIS